MISNSCIYNGKVIHKRFKPKEHFFEYSVFSLLVDLSELSILEKELKIFSYNKFNILSFYDIDHGPRDGTSLINWVKNNLDKNKILKKIDFMHPYYNYETLINQKRLNLLQNKKNILFCGSYFGYGFHEDGIKSSIDMIKFLND